MLRKQYVTQEYFLLNLNIVAYILFFQAFAKIKFFFWVYWQKTFEDFKVKIK